MEEALAESEKREKKKRAVLLNVANTRKLLKEALLLKQKYFGLLK